MVGIADDLIEEHAPDTSDYTTDVPDYAMDVSKYTPNASDYTLSMFDYIPGAIDYDAIIASDYGDTDQGEWMSGCFTM